MRHRVYGKILGRDKNERQQLFRSLVESLILSERIETTQAKAKAVRGLFDKIVNLAKSKDTKRLVTQFLTHKKTVEKLEGEILPRVKSRTSGYTSITRIGKRLGDGAMMVSMSLILEDKKSSESGVKSPQVTKIEKKEKPKKEDNKS